MSSEPIIEVRNMGKAYPVFDKPHHRLIQMLSGGNRRWYHEFNALRGVSFNVHRGETIGIVGRNGSGKSTLLQIICGTLAPSTGEVHVRGRIAALLELGAGFNPEFTGRENVYLNGSVLGLTRREIDGRFAEIASFADIGEFIEQPVKNYSSGMYVRLAFAVAINVTPDILIIDEALSVGDEAFQRKCFARIEELKSGGCTILFVSHAAASVIQLCDRAIFLDGGEKLFSGPPKDVIAAYQRLLYAPSEQRDSMRKELLAKQDCEGDDYSRESAACKDGNGREDAFNLMVTASDLSEVERYDPGLQSESTLEFASRGAIIDGPHVVNTSDRKVNVLVPGNEYIYKYSVDFTMASTNVSFGMMIKSITGVELFGMSSHADGRSIPYVSAGQRFDVEFRFCSKFLPGTYFINAGCMGCSQDGEASFLHRIIDAVLFRVEMKATDRSKAGFYDLSAEPSCHITARAEA
ncbi:ABC transporter ATP-binding protein [Rhodanobacter sp. FW102-FHT14D06]|uniref:ABC transporter ATP-binding protein n=2 Tax=unclassified Rhodanobacter TaxID=2621553 RepID=A0AB74UMA7_9GAMM